MKIFTPSLNPSHRSTELTTKSREGKSPLPLWEGLGEGFFQKTKLMQIYHVLYLCIYFFSCGFSFNTPLFYFFNCRKEVFLCFFSFLRLGGNAGIHGVYEFYPIDRFD